LENLGATYALHQKIAFEPPFGELRGNVRTPSIGRWNARVEFTIRHNEIFRCLTVETLYIVNICRNRRVSKKGGLLWVQISDERGRHPPTTVNVRKAEWLPFSVVSKYPYGIVSFCHKARMW